MEILNKTEHFKQMVTNLDLAIENRSKILIWQTGPDGHRKIHYARLQSIDSVEDKLLLNSLRDDAFEFSVNELYLFVEGINVILKTQQISSQHNIIEARFPAELRFINAEESSEVLGMLLGVNETQEQLASSKGRSKPKSSRNMKKDHYVMENAGTDHIKTGWMVKMTPTDKAIFDDHVDFITLDAEDKLFEDIRHAPRAKPAKGKMVTLESESGSKGENSYHLYDLSQGGLSFLIFNKDDYKAGETLLIKSFNTSFFEEALRVEVKAVREADQLGVQFKVGCQFI